MLTLKKGVVIDHWAITVLDGRYNSLVIVLHYRSQSDMDSAWIELIELAMLIGNCPARRCAWR